MPVYALRLGGFNSRTPGGVRLCLLEGDRRPLGVSIHAPREGCDSLEVGS